MSNDSKLTVIEQQAVPFYDDSVMAIRASSGVIYVPIRPLCENLGIDWSSQRQRIKRDAVLSKHFVVVTTTKSGKGNPNMLCLPLHYIQGWLFGINASRVKPEIRESLIQYQEKCYAVLAEAFSPEKSKVGRLYQLYKKAGRSDAWIEARLQSIQVRQALTDEWKERGVKSDEYAILTDEISKETFGLTTGEYRELKQLEGENLRDQMSNLELIFTMLGEASTTEIAQQEDAQGFDQNFSAAQEGGKIAGDARKALETQTGRPVITSDNFLPKQTQPSLFEGKPESEDEND